MGGAEAIVHCDCDSLLHSRFTLEAVPASASSSARTRARRPFWEVDLLGPLVVVLGGEDKGLTPAILKRCDEIATIPLRAGLDSLNVSVAAGVVVFERARQAAARR
jgi:23S rRNA (guanosine2251-2'-O)-methyltransferase